MSLNPFTAEAPELPDGVSDIIVERYQRDGYVLIWKRVVRYDMFTYDGDDTARDRMMWTRLQEQYDGKQ